MPFETLPTADELNRMDDLSGAALYSAEVKRIAFIPREEQSEYIEAARSGDETAQHWLILNCLNWTMLKAQAAFRDQAPTHSDVMDLIGEANVKMLEAMPNALQANDPVVYLMGVSAIEIWRYCAYHDPLIQRSKDNPSVSHQTVSLDAACTPASLEAPDTPAKPELRLVYNALGHLSERHRAVLTAAYGLYGETTYKNEDIATMLNLPKGTVEKYLWRAKRQLAVKLGPYVTELGLRERELAAG